jgi:hypothetical protein
MYTRVCCSIVKLSIAAASVAVAAAAAAALPRTSGYYRLPYYFMGVGMLILFHTLLSTDAVHTRCNPEIYIY